MIPTKKSISKKQVSLVIADLVILAAVPFITVYIYFLIKLGFGFKLKYLQFDNVYLYFANLLMFITVFYVMDIYNFKKNFATKREIFNIFLAICIAWIFSIFLFYLMGHTFLGRATRF